MKSGDLAATIGKGLVAGAVGTAAMTVSSSIEARIRGREGSTAPADAAGKVLGVQPKNDEAKARFATVVHWAYGSAWGTMRGLLGAAGVPGPAAAAAHFVTVWGSELVMLPRLDVAPPVTEWDRAEIGIDVLHHAVYVIATSVAYRFLERHVDRGRLATDRGDCR